MKGALKPGPLRASPQGNVVSRGGSNPESGTMGLAALAASPELTALKGGLDGGNVALACSQATFNFLQNHILPNHQLKIMTWTGEVPFDPEAGIHFIPFELPERSKGRRGPIVASDGNVLLVTSVFFDAYISNPGLPGALIEVDRGGLPQVCFGLLQDDGTQALPAQTVVNGILCNGRRLRDLGGLDTLPTLNDRVDRGVIGYYEVIKPPFPGFPEVVRARMSGFFVGSTLLTEALERCGVTGG